MHAKRNLIRVTIGPPGSIAFRPATDPPPSDPQEPPVPGGQEPVMTFTPPIDIYETAEGLVLEADLPGATESSVIVQLEENVLTLQAEVVAQAPEGATLVHEEYRVGPFQRSFILSDDVDRDRIRAEFKNGILKLILPTSERGRARRIEVKGS